MLKRLALLSFLFLQSCQEPSAAPSSVLEAKVLIEEPKGEVATVFEKIYDEAKWGVDSDGKGTSGPGSNPELAKPYLTFLNTFIKDKKITSIVDVGCGDWQLMSQINLEGIQYTGFDVVESVVKKNEKLFGKHNIKFAYTPDATTAELPKADLLIVKEVLQHLPNHKIAVFLKRIHGYRHVLIANDMVKGNPSENNYDIELGGWRPLDLKAEPFNLMAEEVLYYPSNLKIQVLHIEN